METAVADALVGRVVDGRYRVVRRLARGGMATVYEAVDQRLERTVALKVMHSGLAEDHGFVVRFQQEAKAAARLADPHVVAVFDQGEADGLVYLAMEYVPGRTVREVLREHGPLSPEQALTILEPVLQALQAAHTAGFVHRDVKPENVLITDDGRVKVADFGLARAVSAGTSTTHGMLIGTVAYLSPEQVERGAADPRSDVYAAGILLYEMVTGRVPYAGDSPLSVAYQHVNADVPAPSAARPGLPAEVDAVVTRATRRDPAARYPDVATFLADVRRLRGQLPPARPFRTATDTLVVERDPGLAPTAAYGAATAAGVPAPPATDRARPTGPSSPGGRRSRRRAAGDDPPPAAGAHPARAPGGRPRPRRTVVVAVVAVVLAAALAAFAGWFFGSGPGKRVDVPQVAGLTQQEAESALADAGLTMEVVGQEFSETVSSGLVIRTDPEGGGSARVGSTIQAVTSKGPERYPVPNLRGKTPADAAALLTVQNLRAGDTVLRFDDRVDEGLVVTTEPEPGTRLKPDTAVDLVVSKGPAPVPVPEVVGQSLDDATRALEKAGLQAKAAKQRYDDTVPKGSIIAASPEPGTVVDSGSTVRLTVSKGPPPVQVPNLIDMPRTEAIATLSNLGLRVNVQEGPFTPLDRVISQDPSGGTTVPRGSTVTITIL